MEAGLIAAGEYSFDASELREDDSTGCGPIVCTYHVQSCKPLQKSSVRLQAKPMDGFD